jgi:heme/copper-type cytochrome/quinol oxidase subunit 2
MYPPPYGPVPTSSAYYLGILSIVMAIFLSFIGLVLGIAAVYLGNQDKQKGFPKAAEGVKLGMVGIVVSIIFLALNLINVAFFFF